MALEWLKLNYKDYYDLEMSYEILMQYPEEGSPVVVTYKSAFENKLPEATSVHDVTLAVSITMKIIKIINTA